MRLPASIATAFLAVVLSAPSALRAQRPDSAAASASPAFGEILAGERMMVFARAHLRDSSAEAITAGIRKGAAHAAAGYRRLAASPAETSEILADVMDSFSIATIGARGAVQVSEAADTQQLRVAALRAAQAARIIEQNDRLVAQNDRIIQLLEQLAKKK